MNLNPVTPIGAAAPTGISPSRSNDPVVIWTMTSEGGEAKCVLTIVPLGLEVQYVLNGSLLSSRRFDRPGDVAWWAARKQLSLQKRGWVQA